jgi:hypothetical protein
MKLWIDDIRPAPEGYVEIKTVYAAKAIIIRSERRKETIELISVDHDAGIFAEYGGDYIKLLDWLEETGRNYPIRIHSMNPVGVENIRRIIQRNGWEEIK